MTSTRDYYEILSVTRTASADEIKRSFYKLARQYHPDVNKETDAATRFKEINEAYQVLSDPEKRASYDRFGKAGVGNDFNGGFSDVPLNDIFETIFGAGFGGRMLRGIGLTGRYSHSSTASRRRCLRTFNSLATVALETLLQRAVI